MAVIKNLRRRAQLNKRLDQFKKDRVILLICLGVALSLWIPTKMAQVYKIEKKVRLEFRLPAGYTFLKPPPEDIRVLIEGRGWSLLYDALFSREIVLRYSTGSNASFDLNPGRLRSAIFERLHSTNLSIAELNYDEIHLRVEPLAWKQVPVRFAGNLEFFPEYYLKEEIRLIPDRVLIKGPNSVVRRLESAPTDSINLKGLSNDFQDETALHLPPGVTASPGRIRVSLRVEQYTEKQIFVPIRPASGSNAARFFPAQVRISFRVGLSRFDKVRSTDFEVLAELPQNPAASDGEKAQLMISKMPPLIRSVRLTPESVDFLIIEQNR
jgi:hypothetical protein